MIEISVGRTELFKLLKEIIPPAFIPEGYQISDIRTRELGEESVLSVTFEKKNGEGRKAVNGN